MMRKFLYAAVVLLAWQGTAHADDLWARVFQCKNNSVATVLTRGGKSIHYLKIPTTSFFPNGTVRIHRETEYNDPQKGLKVVDAIAAKCTKISEGSPEGE